ncbi:MAG TPA: hypothetical protein VGN37_06170 [Actinocatenispora sp.]
MRLAIAPSALSGPPTTIRSGVDLGGEPGEHGAERTAGLGDDVVPGRAAELTAHFP